MTDAELGLRAGLPYRVRHAVGPWIDRLAELLGRPDYHVRPAEYAGTADCSMRDLEAKLQADGFSWAPFSLFHRTPADTRPVGSWTYRPSVLADRQLHVVLFAQSPETIDVYAHTEYNWLRHPLDHARQVGIDRRKGATLMRQWLHEREVAYDYESRTVRRLTHLLERVRERVSG